MLTLSYLLFIICFTVNVKGKISQYHAKLYWKISAQGFHREIKYNLEIVTDGTWSGCKMQAKQVIPRNLYVNKDQLEDLRRLKKVTAVVYDYVDTEMPEDLSLAHDVYLHSLLNESDNIVTSDIYLPVHVRYHPPQPGGGFESAILSPPDIYIFCNKFSADLPIEMLHCSPDSAEMCEYSQLTYDIEEKTLEILVPVGNSNHFDAVVLVTYFVTIGGTLYLITVILLSLPKQKKNV